MDDNLLLEDLPVKEEAGTLLEVTASFYDFRIWRVFLYKRKEYATKEENEKLNLQKKKQTKPELWESQFIHFI